MENVRAFPTQCVSLTLKNNVCSLDLIIVMSKHKILLCTQMCTGPKCQAVSSFFFFFSFAYHILGKTQYQPCNNKQTEKVAFLLPNSRLRPREMQRPCKGWTDTLSLCSFCCGFHSLGMLFKEPCFSLRT